MKLLILLAVVGVLVPALWAEDEKPVFPSPNGKYEVKTGQDAEGMKTFTLVSAKTGEVLVELDALGNPYKAEFRLIWAPDSQRAATFSPDRRGGWTHLFVRDGEKFREIELPDMPKLKWNTRADAKTVTAARIPVRWAKANVLLIDHEVEDDNGVSAKARVALTFNEKNVIKAATAKP